MAKSDLMNKREILFAEQMLTFKENIGTHAASLGLTPAQVAAQAADADYYYYVVMGHNMVQNHARAWTVLKKSLRGGKKPAVTGDLPALDLPAPVPAVAPGLERRFRTLVRMVKASDNYNQIIGNQLNIEAVDHAAPDYATLAPKITVKIISGRAEIGWDWQSHRAFLDLCQLEADRSDGKGFVPLVYSTKRCYTDKTPFPADPVRWRYRGIYRVGDGQVGKWSNIASVTVPP
jgi:hypothetical protein